jgi:Asp-tRNA(Asn)/Glu-tRNA(Gln) amidotransferase A subunit family amidase
LQLIGPALADARVLAVARAFEAAQGAHRMPPVVAAV